MIRLLVFVLLTWACTSSQQPDAADLSMITSANDLATQSSVDFARSSPDLAPPCGSPTDSANCGGCGFACAPGQSCVEGVCGATLIYAEMVQPGAVANLGFADNTRNLFTVNNVPYLFNRTTLAVAVAGSPGGDFTHSYVTGSCECNKGDLDITCGDFGGVSQIVYSSDGNHIGWCNGSPTAVNAIRIAIDGFTVFHAFGNPSMPHSGGMTVWAAAVGGDVNAAEYGLGYVAVREKMYRPDPNNPMIGALFATAPSYITKIALDFADNNAHLIYTCDQGTYTLPTDSVDPMPAPTQILAEGGLFTMDQSYFYVQSTATASQQAHLVQISRADLSTKVLAENTHFTDLWADDGNGLGLFGGTDDGKLLELPHGP